MGFTMAKVDNIVPNISIREITSMARGRKECSPINSLSIMGNSRIMFSMEKDN